MNNLTFEARVSPDHRLPVPEEVPTGTLVRVHLEPVTGDAVLDDYQPRTELGLKLIELRRAYVLGGGTLLDWDGISQEVRDRRGGVSDD